MHEIKTTATFARVQTNFVVPCTLTSKFAKKKENHKQIWIQPLAEIRIETRLEYGSKTYFQTLCYIGFFMHSSPFLGRQKACNCCLFFYKSCKEVYFRCMVPTNSPVLIWVWFISNSCRCTQSSIFLGNEFLWFHHKRQFSLWTLWKLYIYSSKFSNLMSNI